MNWYLQSSNDSDIAKSTRIRFARNIKGFVFDLVDKREINKLEEYIKEKL